MKRLDEQGKGIIYCVEIIVLRRNTHVLLFRYFQSLED